jgi:hypothetical protein
VKRYLRAELERFLTGVDSALTRRVDVVIIGGAASISHSVTAVSPTVHTTSSHACAGRCRDCVVSS